MEGPGSVSFFCFRKSQVLAGLGPGDPGKPGDSADGQRCTEPGAAAVDHGFGCPSAGLGGAGRAEGQVRLSGEHQDWKARGKSAEKYVTTWDPTRLKTKHQGFRDGLLPWG